MKGGTARAGWHESAQASQRLLRPLALVQTLAEAGRPCRTVAALGALKCPRTGKTFVAGAAARPTAATLADMANSLKRFLTIFGYKLDRKWGNFKARVKEKTEKSASTSWSGVRSPIDNLRRKKKNGFGKLDDRNVPQELPAFGAYCQY